MRTIPLCFALTLTFASTACGNAPVDSQEETLQAFEEASRGAEELIIRECTCEDASSYGPQFEDWPAFDDCVAENASNVERALELHGEEPYLVKYLAPTVTPGAVTEQWYVGSDEAGIHRHETICDTVPAGDDCGWHLEDFSQSSIGSSASDVELTCGAATVDRLSITLDGETRELPWLGSDQ